MFKKLFTFLFVMPKKFYSDYTPLEKAYWGLWVRPEGNVQLAKELNKDLLKSISNQIKESNL